MEYLRTLGATPGWVNSGPSPWHCAERRVVETAAPIDVVGGAVTCLPLNTWWVVVPGTTRLHSRPPADADFRIAIDLPGRSVDGSEVPQDCEQRSKQASKQPSERASEQANKQASKHLKCPPRRVDSTRMPTGNSSSSSSSHQPVTSQPATSNSNSSSRSSKPGDIPL